MPKSYWCIHGICCEGPILAPPAHLASGNDKIQFRRKIWRGRSRKNTPIRHQAENEEGVVVSMKAPMNSAATWGTIALPAPRNKPTLPDTPSTKGKMLGSIRLAFPSRHGCQMAEDQKVEPPLATDPIEFSPTHLDLHPLSPSPACPSNPDSTPWATLRA